MKLKTANELTYNSYLNNGFLVKTNNFLTEIKSQKDIFKIYNDKDLILDKKSKILLEACMVYGLSKKALDFFLGYFSPKKDTPKWGWKTLKQAQIINQRYLADKLYFESIKEQK